MQALAPPGTNIIRERVSSASRKITQHFTDSPCLEREINYTVKMRGFANNHIIPGTHNVIVGETSDKDVHMFSLPHETPWEWSFSTDQECNVSLYTDGTDPEHCQGTWRFMPSREQSQWIGRSANVDRKFTLVKQDTSEGKESGIKDNDNTGLVLFKVMPIVNYDTEEYRKSQLNDDGLVKCRRKKTRSANKYSVAGTAYGEHSTQTFTTAKPKKTINASHLETSFLLSCLETPSPRTSKYDSAYGKNPEPPTRSTRNHFNF